MHLASVGTSACVSCALLAVPALAGEISIHGSVTGAAGPLEGVEVALHRILSEHEDALLLLSGAEKEEPVAVSRTDSAGRYRLLAPGPGMWRVRARRAGAAPMALDLVPLVEERVLPELRLPGARDVRVRILSEGGNPVPGARVLVFGEAGRAAGSALADPAWAAARRFRVTGPDGSVVLEKSPGSG